MDYRKSSVVLSLLSRMKYCNARLETVRLPKFRRTFFCRED